MDTRENRQPPQHQARHPGVESAMAPQPDDMPRFPGLRVLACDDSPYVTGQVLQPNGGEIVGG